MSPGRLPWIEAQAELKNSSQFIVRRIIEHKKLNQNICVEAGCRHR
jgi:hypothetical protein